jgi:hypothetical protein
MVTPVLLRGLAGMLVVRVLVVVVLMVVTAGFGIGRTASA